MSETLNENLSTSVYNQYNDRRISDKINAITYLFMFQYLVMNMNIV